MSENSKIEWTDHTFNPWEGCQKVGPGCDHCYAETRNARFGGGQAINWGPGAPRRRTSPANWRKPLAWNAQHEKFFAKHGRRQRVFCASLADVFDNAVDPVWRADLFGLIECTPNLDWLLLTKRIGNVQQMVEAATCLSSLPDNVWLGATICNQAEADRDIPKLLTTPARVHFLSMEPLLGPVNIADIPDPSGGICIKPLSGIRWLSGTGTRCGSYPVASPKIDWVIAGGESGPGARPMHPDWARNLRDQCAAAGVPFLFKQWGEWAPHIGAVDGWSIPDSPEASRYPHSEWDGDHWGEPFYPMWSDTFDELQTVSRIGKKLAGRLLDGVQHDGFPEAS